MRIRPQAAAIPTAVADPDWGQGRPDPRALAVAQELQERLPDTQVMLFGSRAGGRWRPRSDLDLAVIGMEEDLESESSLRNTAKAMAGDLYDRPPDIQIFPIPRSEFEKFRTSLPHIAGQVQSRGLTPEGEHLPLMTQDNPWPGVRTLLQSTRRHLERALGNLEQYPDEAVFHAHSALETVLKAALGAAKVDFEFTHNLQDLVRQAREEAPATLLASMEGFPSAAQLNEWTKFRLQVPYSGETVPWPADSAEEIVGTVQRLSGILAGHALESLGKSPHDVGYAEWLGNGPLAGWESLPLDYFSQAEVEERIIQEIRAAERTDLAVATLRVFLGSDLTPAVLDRIEAAWRAEGPPPDYLQNLKDAQQAPDNWRSLLLSDHHEPDTDRASNDRYCV